MHFKAVLFDLDGTLLDTLEDLAASMNSALDANGFPTHPVSRYKSFVGNGVENLARVALPEDAVSADTIKRCVEVMQREYGNHWNMTTRPYPGVAELLSGLLSKGVKPAILSNKPHEFTKKIVTHYFPDIPFVAVFGQRSGVPRKPDPAAALEAADLLECKPGEVLYLGDSDTDMKTAAAAGMYAVGALWGFRTAEELKSNGARVLIGKPEELLDLL